MPHSKLPFYAPSTTAFQRLSFAYETLSKPSSRRLYDLRGPREFDPGEQPCIFHRACVGHSSVPVEEGPTKCFRYSWLSTAKPKHGPPGAADETLNGVLRNVISEVSHT